MASNFEFYSPTRVIFGKGTEQRVGALVREYGGTRVLIVYGGKSAVRSGVLDRAEKSLAEAGVFAHVVALDSNAPIETVRHIHGIAHA